MVSWDIPAWLGKTVIMAPAIAVWVLWFAKMFGCFGE